uniref:Uncharacterized protein n=1 Tax=Rhipicephalus microplus TaxID=6941 RepID=A0A6M2D8E1_RHIMP
MLRQVWLSSKQPSLTRWSHEVHFVRDITMHRHCICILPIGIDAEEAFYVVLGPEGSQVGIIDGGWNAHAAGAARHQMAQVVCELLQLLKRVLRLFAEDMVMRGPARSDRALVATEEEVQVSWLSDPVFDGRPWWNVHVYRLLIQNRQKSSVVPLLNNDERHRGFVIGAYASAGFLDCIDFFSLNFLELTLTYSISVDDYPVRQPSMLAIIEFQVVRYHGLQVRHDFLTGHRSIWVHLD